MKKVVITGADGFVGSYLTNIFKSHGIQSIAVSRHFYPTRVTPSKLVQYCVVDTASISLLKSVCTGADTFINLAWGGISGPARADINLQLTNIQNTFECYQFAKQIGCEKFIQVGSIMEGELLNELKKDPDQNLNPSYIYSLSKLYAHSCLNALYDSTDSGPVVITPSISNAYGVSEDITNRRLLNTTLQKIARGHELSFSSGVQIYDFAYVLDVANALYLIAESGKPNRNYVIGSGNPRPLKEWLMDVINITGFTGKYSFGTETNITGSELPAEAFSIKNLQEDTGYAPLISFEDGVNKTYRWILTKLQTNY